MQRQGPWARKYDVLLLFPVILFSTRCNIISTRVS